MVDIDKILDAAMPSEMVRQYLKGKAKDLTERQIAEIVCGAPISVFQKRQLLQELAAGGGIYAEQLQILQAAIDGLQLKADELFCLCGYCNENGERVQLESLPFKHYQKAIEYAAQEELADNVWYVLEKWKSDAEENYYQTFAYILLGCDICYFYSTTNLGKTADRNTYRNAEMFANGVNLNLPLPFAVGDIIKADCAPFAPVQNVLITEVGDNKDCCCVQGVSLDRNGDLVSGAFKHGSCIAGESFNVISPIYRAERVVDLLQADKKLRELRAQYITKIFIGGSKSICALPLAAIQKLKELCSSAVDIMVGDAFGADKAVQEFLVEVNYRPVTVYASGGKVRNNVGNWPIVAVPSEAESGYDFYKQKDIAMANDCDGGVMIWDGKSRGTLNNLKRLAAAGKPCVVYLRSSECGYTVSNVQQLDEFLRKAQAFVGRKGCVGRKGFVGRKGEE
jgi:adenine-specific DNA-methyltransferase